MEKNFRLMIGNFTHFDIWFQWLKAVPFLNSGIKNNHFIHQTKCLMCKLFFIKTEYLKYCFFFIIKNKLFLVGVTFFKEKRKNILYKKVLIKNWQEIIFLSE